MTSPRNCFVIMPFRAELNYFYLYLQQYLRSKHGLHVERGDHRILTKPLLEKIRDQIRRADVIIADITHRNPNVFYELGLAHAAETPVILITQDNVEDAPADIRHLEFIVYHLARHDDFLTKLDNAIHNVSVEDYKSLYTRASRLLKSLNAERRLTLTKTSIEEFQARVVQGERTQGLPEKNDQAGWAAFLLPRVVHNPWDAKTMHEIDAWLFAKFGK
jgi:nucleoside 2-deoxyribosyltransferase